MTSNPEVILSSAEAESAQAEGPANSGLRARILIVDDSYMVAEMLSNFLGKQGCTIAYALDGAAALELVRQQTPDLIIADWVMPTLDGLQLCRRIRQSPDYAWIYYIIMTAREGNDSMERALEAGADEFLSKPFQAAELMTRVRAGLRIVELRRQQHSKISQQPQPSPSLSLANIGTRQTLVANLLKRITQARSLQEPLSLFVLRLANLSQLSRDLTASCKVDLLEQFSRRLMDNLREEDSLFRYDEGQFIVMLAGTTLAAAQIAAERCCQRMVQQAFIAHNQTIEVQIQYGTAALVEGDDLQGMSLLKRAVLAMRDNQNLPGAILSSPIAQISGMEHLLEKLKAAQAQNLELRMKLAQFAKVETENRQLRQKVQALSAQLQQARSTPSE